MVGIGTDDRNWDAADRKEEAVVKESAQDGLAVLAGNGVRLSLLAATSRYDMIAEEPQLTTIPSAWFKPARPMTSVPTVVRWGHRRATLGGLTFSESTIESKPSRCFLIARRPGCLHHREPARSRFALARPSRDARHFLNACELHWTRLPWIRCSPAARRVLRPSRRQGVPSVEGGNHARTRGLQSDLPGIARAMPALV
jgi:hypothetical protein